MGRGDLASTNQEGAGAVRSRTDASRPGRWRRLICALRGHELVPAMPDHVLRCEYCAGVWTWVGLFRGHIPRVRRHTQRAYDDIDYQNPIGIIG